MVYHDWSKLMALIEEVFENNGKLFTAHSGREVKRSECEEKGGVLWTKPSCLPLDAVTREYED
jgi:hypothetical protein